MLLGYKKDQIFVQQEESENPKNQGVAKKAKKGLQGLIFHPINGNLEVKRRGERFEGEGRG